MEKILYYLMNYYKSLIKDSNTSKIKYLYSRIIYVITLKLALFIRATKIKEVNKQAVKKYFDLYGTEDTMNNFHFTVETLIEILGFNIDEIDLEKFLKFKGK